MLRHEQQSVPPTLVVLSAVQYGAAFASIFGVVGGITGQWAEGALAGGMLGVLYGTARAFHQIGLAPLWLVAVMLAGTILGPAVDADPLTGALLFAAVYGWIGFLPRGLFATCLAVAAVAFLAVAIATSLG